MTFLKTFLYSISKILNQVIGATYKLPIYLISGLFPKSNKICLFGEWGGNLRFDNSEFLFRAFRDEFPQEMKFYIIYNDHESQRGINYVKKYSLMSYYLHLRAGFIFVSSGKTDLISHLISTKTVYVNIWHAIPIKKIMRLTDHYKKNQKMIAFRNRFLPYLDETPDYIWCPKEYTKIFQQAFAPKKGIINLEFPRIFFSPKKSCVNTTILYAPTFRDHDRSYFPVSEEELKLVDEALDNTDQMKLLISLHPACTYKFDASYKNINIISTQIHGFMYRDILPYCDALITDISGLYFEAKDLNLPIVQFFPDKEQYVAKSRGLINEVYEKINVPNALTFNQAIEIVKQNIKPKSDFNKTQIDKMSKQNYLTEIANKAGFKIV